MFRAAAKPLLIALFASVVLQGAALEPGRNAARGAELFSNSETRHRGGRTPGLRNIDPFTTQAWFHQAALPVSRS